MSVCETGWVCVCVCECVCVCVCVCVSWSLRRKSRKTAQLRNEHEMSHVTGNESCHRKLVISHIKSAEK